MLALRNNINVKVFYTWSQSQSGNKYDPGFGKHITWDIPLLDGYDYSFVNNISSSPGSHHFKGIDNPTLIDDIQHWKADAVFIYGWAFKSHLKAMRYFNGKIPVLFRGDSTLLDQKVGIKKVLRKIFLRIIYSNIDVAMYVGKANESYFLAHGLKHNQLFFMPHAIENERFFCNEIITTNANKLLHNLKIPPNALVFLFAGKLEPKKQPDVLAKIFSELNRKDVHLIIAGTGILEKKMKAEFAKFSNIHFVGFYNQYEMPILYASCSVFILPSKGPGETWGLAINEAMAAGKAIIVSDACGAASDLVKHFYNGFVFRSDSEQDMKSTIMFFIENKDEVEIMGEKSLQIIKNYTYENDCIVLEMTLNKLMYRNLL
jgi:glycosyltransferase involved in cell wall biosynthesis